MMDGVSDLLTLTSTLNSNVSDSSNPALYVRSPKDADDREVVYTFPDDDPYGLLRFS